MFRDMGQRELINAKAYKKRKSHYFFVPCERIPWYTTNKPGPTAKTDNKLSYTYINDSDNDIHSLWPNRIVGPGSPLKHCHTQSAGIFMGLAFREYEGIMGYVC